MTWPGIISATVSEYRTPVEAGSSEYRAPDNAGSSKLISMEFTLNESMTLAVGGVSSTSSGGAEGDMALADDFDAEGPSSVGSMGWGRRRVGAC